jgi:hypothetical protein
VNRGGKDVKTRKIFVGIVAAILILMLGGGFAFVEDTGLNLKGKVQFLDQEGLSLEKKMDMAAQEFKNSGKGDVYFTGYAFLSRHEIHHDGNQDAPYVMSVKDGKIKRRRAYNTKSGDTSSTGEETEIVGLLMMHAVSGGKIHLADMELIDLDNTYEFEDIPLYWLGKVENEKSFRFLTEKFRSSELKFQKDMLFIISSHVHPEVYNILHKTALGNYEMKIRENAIFWLGTLKDARAFKGLKDIFKRVDETKLKKQVVFAYQMSENKEAVKELVRIAKNKEESAIRKEAIFWLGQKASEESVTALEDVVNDAGEDTKVKESAVFAISQLPSEKSVPMLIDIARTNKNPKVKKQAIFWLGQKDDDAALKFFEEILLKKK